MVYIWIFLYGLDSNIVQSDDNLETICQVTIMILRPFLIILIKWHCTPLIRSE